MCLLPVPRATVKSHLGWCWQKSPLPMRSPLTLPCESEFCSWRMPHLKCRHDLKWRKSNSKSNKVRSDWGWTSEDEWRKDHIPPWQGNSRIAAGEGSPASSSSRANAEKSPSGQRCFLTSCAHIPAFFHLWMMHSHPDCTRTLQGPGEGVALNHRMT